MIDDGPGLFLAGLVRRTGVAVLERDRAHKRQFRAISRRAETEWQRHLQRIHLRPERTQEIMLSSCSTTPVSFCLLSRAWTFAVEAGVSRGRAEETEGSPSTA